MDTAVKVVCPLMIHVYMDAVKPAMGMMVVTDYQEDTPLSTALVVQVVIFPVIDGLVDQEERAKTAEPLVAAAVAGVVAVTTAAILTLVVAVAGVAAADVAARAVAAVLPAAGPLVSLSFAVTRALVSAPFKPEMVEEAETVETEDPGAVVAKEDCEGSARMIAATVATVEMEATAAGGPMAAAAPVAAVIVFTVMEAILSFQTIIIFAALAGWEDPRQTPDNLGIH